VDQLSACMDETGPAVLGLRTCVAGCVTNYGCVDNCLHFWIGEIPSRMYASDILFAEDGLRGSECNSCGDLFMDDCIRSTTPGADGVNQLLTCVSNNCR